MDRADTSYVERSHLTVRMGNGRFTRLTNASSKRREDHVTMLRLFCHYSSAGSTRDCG